MDARTPASFLGRTTRRVVVGVQGVMIAKLVPQHLGFFEMLLAESTYDEK